MLHSDLLSLVYLPTYRVKGKGHSIQNSQTDGGKGTIVPKRKIKTMLPSEEEMISGHRKMVDYYSYAVFGAVVCEACCLLSGLAFGISLLPGGLGISPYLGGYVSLLHTLLNSVSLQQRNHMGCSWSSLGETCPAAHKCPRPAHQEGIFSKTHQEHRAVLDPVAQCPDVLSKACAPISQLLGILFMTMMAHSYAPHWELPTGML